MREEEMEEESFFLVKCERETLCVCVCVCV